MPVISNALPIPIIFDTISFVDLFEELTLIVHRLQEAKVEFAVCGGLAMAVHGFPRATIDIDLMILAESLDAVLEEAKKIGYTLEAGRMNMALGAVPIHRVTKIDSDDFLRLDLILVTAQLEDTWNERIMVEWESGQLCVVSREGLKKMKRLRNSGQDQDDIKRLDEIDED